MSDSPAATDIELTTSPDADSQASGGGRASNSQLQAAMVPWESAAADDGSMSNELCGVDTNARIRQFEHGLAVTSVCFSPDGNRIATGSLDKFARVFDVGTGKEILKTIEHGDRVSSVCFSADGNSIATGSWDKFARVFCINDRNEEQTQALEPCFTIRADHIALSSKDSIAVVTDRKLQLLPLPHNFSRDAWLPVSPSLLLLWGKLPHAHQKQCFFSDSQVVLSEFFASSGGGVVALASKWRDPDFPLALPTLKRLFDGEEPVVNAGLILRELLDTGPDELPNAATIQALLGNVSRHASFAARDFLLAEQLVRVTCIPSIRSVVGEFWAELVELVPSSPVVIHNVQQVSFSETTRMYVAASDSTSEPVFERHFNKHPQVKGPPLDFEHFLVPFPNASAHRDVSGGSMMQALVETDNIDIFGTVAVRAIVQYKWQKFGLRLWLKEFFVYSIGLALLVALSILTWQYWALQRDDALPVDSAVVSALFAAVIARSLYRETKQFVYSIPDGDGTLLKRIMSSDQFSNFWNWLDLLHIALGMCVLVLVWAQSPKALPVLAVTAFLRWWGTLFYLQVCTHCLLSLHVEPIKRVDVHNARAGVRQIRPLRPHAGGNRQSNSLVPVHHAHQHSGHMELIHAASQAPLHRP